MKVNTNILKPFCDEINFSNLLNRIRWGNKLDSVSKDLEKDLYDCDEKYLLWFIGTINDIFAYNYLSSMTKEQFNLIKIGIEIIYKQEKCNKDSFEKYHLQLVESEITLLPTSQKVIDEFGE